jgi:hypothetical protein
MASDKDILGKADALLRRHSVGAPGTGSDTGGVPVLTDLIDEAARQPPVQPEPHPSMPGPHDELAREVYTRVMAQLEGRLAADLERRLAQHLASHTHAAVAGALGDLRQEIANAIGDAVSEALARRPVK